MKSLLTNPRFRTDYHKLKEVKLNPARHSASHAHEHCEMVAGRVIQLAALNSCSDQETRLLHNLALAHDIGKLFGVPSWDFLRRQHSGRTLLATAGEPYRW